MGIANWKNEIELYIENKLKKALCFLENFLITKEVSIILITLHNKHGIESNRVKMKVIILKGKCIKKKGMLIFSLNEDLSIAFRILHFF